MVKLKVTVIIIEQVQLGMHRQWSVSFDIFLMLVKIIS